MKKLFVLIFLISSVIYSQNIYFSEPTSSHIDYISQTGQGPIAYNMYAANGWVIHWYRAKLTYPGGGNQSNWMSGETGGWWVNKAGTYQIRGEASGTYIGTGTTHTLYAGPISFTVVDNYAPSAPQNLSYENDDNYPRIEWSNNTEYDIGGYIIEKKIGPTYNFNYLATTSQNSYLDDTEELSGIGSHTIWYRVKAYDINSHESDYSSNLSVDVAGYALDKRNPNVNLLNNDYALFNNYPNPFNPSTVIAYNLPKAEYVSLKIFNTLGKEIAELVSQNTDAGYHEVSFDASNYPTGIYFYHLKAGNFSKINKMLLVK